MLRKAPSASCIVSPRTSPLSIGLAIASQSGSWETRMGSGSHHDLHGER